MSHKLLLKIAALICLGWVIRCIFTQSLRYGFIPFNIFLAVIPLLLEYPMIRIARQLSGVIKKVALGILGVLWLLFIPNAFYLLTDFMHLNPSVLVNQRGDQYRHVVQYDRGDTLYVYDSLLLFAAVAFGAYVGALALLHAYRFIAKRLSRPLAYSILALVMVLSGAAVYIGRFSRWNSWQGLTHPLQIASEFIRDLADPLARERIVVIGVTIVIFQIVSVWLVSRSSDDKTR